MWEQEKPLVIPNLSVERKPTALVTGAGGFIGHHLVKFLKSKDFYVRGVDIKDPEFERTYADEFWDLDLRNADEALDAMDGMDHVYALAADMGGMGFISHGHADILTHNIGINLNTINAAHYYLSMGADEDGNAYPSRYLYTSSACVYPEYRQEDANVIPLAEWMAYPAQPQDAYGWEKLVTEHMCTHAREDWGLDTRIVRFHNIFGPLGTWRGGREKAPAALCRKIAVAKLTGQKFIEMWGDGNQTRSFCYIDDCVRGIYMLMQSDFHEPINLGQDRMVSINELAWMIMSIADVRLDIVHIDGPQGVRGRNSDNTLMEKTLGWKPEVSLEEGLTITYQWIENEVQKVLAKNEAL